jgi:hypothetical protein
MPFRVPKMSVLGIGVRQEASLARHTETRIPTPRIRTGRTNPQQHHDFRSLTLCTFTPEARNQSPCLTTSPTASMSRASTFRECAPQASIERIANRPPATSEGMNDPMRKCSSPLTVRRKRNTNPGTSLLKLEGVDNTAAAQWYAGKRVACTYNRTRPDCLG